MGGVVFFKCFNILTKYSHCLTKDVTLSFCPIKDVTYPFLEKSSLSPEYKNNIFSLHLTHKIKSSKISCHRWHLLWDGGSIFLLVFLSYHHFISLILVFLILYHLFTENTSFSFLNLCEKKISPFFGTRFKKIVVSSEWREDI